MQGFNAMWMPGIDHASIAVHVLLEKDLKRRENKTRFDLGRDEFMRRAWAWKERSGSRISRAGEADGLLARLAARAVHDGRALEPRGARGVRPALRRGPDLPREADDQLGSGRARPWCRTSRSTPPRRTARCGRSGIRSSAAAARSSSRRRGPRRCSATPRSRSTRRTSATSHFHGKEVELPLTGRRIPIVPIDIIRDGKSWPDPAFGSGAVKVTPAHDPNDYEVSQIANLPILQVIDRTGQDVRAGAGEVRRHDRRGGAQGRGRGSRGRRLPRRDQAVQGAARPQPALGRGDRADADGAVVGQGRSRSPTRRSPRSSRARPSSSPSTTRRRSCTG